MSTRWRLIAALWPVAMLNYIDRQVIYSLFPLLRDDLRLTDAQLGLASTAFLWVYAFASPLTGYLADRVGSRKLLLGSLAIWSTITWLTGRAGSFAELVAARALMGASEAFYLPAALSLIAAHHPEATRSRATGLHYSGLYLGVILGGVGGGWIGQHYGWRLAFLILGIAGLAYGCLLPFMLPDAPGGRAPAPPLWSAWRQLITIPAMWSLLAVFAATSAANWLVYTWMPLYLYERFGMSLAEAGFAATFWLQIGSVAGIIGGGLLADRWALRHRAGRIWVQAAGLAAAAPCLILAGATSSSVILLAGLAVFGLGRGVFDANAMPILCGIVPVSLRSTGYGLLNFAGVLSGGLMAAGAGYAKAGIGLGSMVGLAGILLMAATVILIRVARSAAFARSA
jgi:predicted MFS family arabinose efflux permease